MGVKRLQVYCHACHSKGWWKVKCQGGADINSAIACMPGRLQGLENFVWSEFLKTKTFVLNDAVSALMAEARLGVAEGKKNVVMLTLSSPYPQQMREQPEADNYLPDPQGAVKYLNQAVAV